jgi:broad specificity phosphatase PhoE
MRTLEVRRHSLRKEGGGSQLSQAGVDLARRLGATTGPFARVATSVVPRARETAIAMGFAVDYEIVTLISEEAMAAEFEDNQWWLTPQPFAALARVVATGGPTHLYANGIVALWRDMMTALPDNSSALVIGHSGQIEAALVAAFPKADHGSWGASFGHCEGARLIFDGEPARFSRLELLRMSAT